jgi:hypothetical protein
MMPPVDTQTISEGLPDEEELLGALLTTPEHIEEVRHRVRGSEFHDLHLGELFGVILRVRNVTLQSVHEFLIKNGISPPQGTRWGTVLSDLVDKGAGLSRQAVLARAAAIRQRSLDRRLRDLFLRMGKAGAEGDDLGQSLASFQREVAEISAEANLNGAGQFVAASRTYAEVLGDETPHPQELITGGVLTVRQVGLWHGSDGARKSWELLQFLLCASIGRECWGLLVRVGGIRCGYLSLEDEIGIVKERLGIISLGHKLTEAEEDLATQNLHILAGPHLKDDPPFDITQEQSQGMLQAWIRANRLELAVIDHLSAAAPSLPNEFDLRPVFLPVRAIARETDSAIILSHHDRKPIQGAKGRDGGGSRGDTRLPAACRFRVHTERIGEENPDGTVLRLTFEKTTGGATPRPIWLLHRRDCPLVITDPPKRSQEAKAERMERMLKAICEAGPEKGLSPADLVNLFRDASGKASMSDRTIRSYGASLESAGRIRREGRAQQTRYFPVSEVRQTESPSEPSSGQCPTQ